MTRQSALSHSRNPWLPAPLHNNPETRHPGINISQIAVDGGAAGLLFSVATVLIFLLGIPSLIWFPIGAAALGLIMSVVFRLLR